MKRLLYPVLALAALTVVVPAAPAAAEPVPDGCQTIGGPYPAGPEIDLDGDGNPEARLPNPSASVCTDADSGLPDPARFACYGGLYDCDLRITTGHTGSASAGAGVCVDATGDGSGPLCATATTGTVPLVPVEENTICMGWSLYQSCRHQHDD